MYMGAVNMKDIRVEERIFEFATQNLYGGRRPEVLLKKLGLVYRKGKTEADITKAKQLACNHPKNDMDLVDDYAKRLYKDVLKSV